MCIRKVIILSSPADLALNTQRCNKIYSVLQYLKCLMLVKVVCNMAAHLGCNSNLLSQTFFN